MMEIKLTKNLKHEIPKRLFGLFFEDINYAADGGFYAELLENRNFEAYFTRGQKGDYYTQVDSSFAWSSVSANGKEPEMLYVMGSPLARENPHYLRLVANEEMQGFQNKAYRGLYLEKGKTYIASFYARTADYTGNFEVCILQDGVKKASAFVEGICEGFTVLRKWNKYTVSFEMPEDTEGATFAILLTNKGIVEFDQISLMPSDAVSGVFRKDLFDALNDLHPGFIRFPGGCVVEGNTLDNRYRWKESVGPIEKRRNNFNRWALHETEKVENHTSEFPHYNQTLGIGYYEYFLLCDLLGASPLPVCNVGLACQFQSYELTEIEDEEFNQYVQDALDLIEFANGDVTTKWGKLRSDMGHPESFHMEFIGIGNEQWETEKVRFFERYVRFEEAIHEKYPDIKIIGSAGPNVTSEYYTAAWDFYHAHEENEKFAYAVDEHYYMPPHWFTENVNFYDHYDRKVKVFSGEYAAHPNPRPCTFESAKMESGLSEACFLTGIERNSDVVVLSSYAPLFARIGYTQWAPDMIWFDEKKVYKSPSYFTQKMYMNHQGTHVVDLSDTVYDLQKENIYVSLSYDAEKDLYILKAINMNEEEKELLLSSDGTASIEKQYIFDSYDGIREVSAEKLTLPKCSFSVFEITVK